MNVNFGRFAVQEQNESYHRSLNQVVLKQAFLQPSSDVDVLHVSRQCLSVLVSISFTLYSAILL